MAPFNPVGRAPNSSSYWAAPQSRADHGPKRTALGDGRIDDHRDGVAFGNSNPDTTHPLSRHPSRPQNGSATPSVRAAGDSMAPIDSQRPSNPNQRQVLVPGHSPMLDTGPDSRRQPQLSQRPVLANTTFVPKDYQGVRFWESKTPKLESFSEERSDADKTPSKQPKDRQAHSQGRSYSAQRQYPTRYREESYADPEGGRADSQRQARPPGPSRGTGFNSHRNRD